MQQIKDRFTKLKGKSRQLRYQLRQAEKGLCRYGDGRKVYKCSQCRKHWQRSLELRRAKYQPKPKVVTFHGKS